MCNVAHVYQRHAGVLSAAGERAAAPLRVPSERLKEFAAAPRVRCLRPLRSRMSHLVNSLLEFDDESSDEARRD